MNVDTYKIITQSSMLIIGIGYIVGYILNDYVRTEELILGNMWLIASMFYGRIDNVKDKK